MSTNYRWFILALAVSTAALVIAAPTMAMPVLFKEISTELNMDLVQIGLLATMTSLTGLFLGLVGGNLGDRFGPRPVIGIACVLVGALGASRSLSFNFATLLLTTFLQGLAQPMININLSKLCAIWFPARERGTANGGLSIGMALGFLLGSLLSATVLSPWLGGWRNVMLFFGALAVLFGLFWFTTRNPPNVNTGVSVQHNSLRADLAHVMSIRNMWIMGLAGFGYGGCVNAMLAYLPLYLRGIGWTNANADSTVALFHLVSLLGTIPFAWLSDHMGQRRPFLLLAALMLAVGVGALSISNGALIVLAVIAAGVLRDGYMAIYMTTVMETKSIGINYAGSAVGFTIIFFQLGGVFAPPLGNSLAQFGSNIPFLFWATLASLSVIAFWFLDTTQLEG